MIPYATFSFYLFKNRKIKWFYITFLLLYPILFVFVWELFGEVDFIIERHVGIIGLYISIPIIIVLVIELGLAIKEKIRKRRST